MVPNQLARNGGALDLVLVVVLVLVIDLFLLASFRLDYDYEADDEHGSIQG